MKDVLINLYPMWVRDDPVAGSLHQIELMKNIYVDDTQNLLLNENIERSVTVDNELNNASQIIIQVLAATQ